LIVDELGGVWMFIKGKTGKGMTLILVVSIIGMGTFSYIPNVHAESNQQNETTPAAQENQLANNTLAKLQIDGIPLNQAFSADVTTYSATVENEIESIQLKMETNDPGSLITVNGQAVKNGSANPFLLQTGENTFLITVNDGSHPANTYILTVTRKKSNNNLLKEIKLSIGELSPKFDSAITDYSVQVANDVDSITLTTLAIDRNATIKVNDSLLKEEGVSVPLPVGKSDINLLATAENGDMRTYTIHITRVAKQENKPSAGTKNPAPNANGNGSMNRNNTQTNRNNSMSQNSTQQNSSSVQKTSTATLSSLKVSQGSWDSSFSTDEFTYHLAVSSDVTAVTINPSATYSSAVISVEGGSNKTVQLAGNKTVISVLVTRGEDRKTYVLVFDKKVQQAETTTVATPQSTDSNFSSTSSNVTSTESTTPTTGAASKLKLGNSQSSTSFWGKVAAYFKKIFN
jgi:hypothetical protein